MVKLIVIARCIPEDIYLAHADQSLPAVAGKKFSLVVREPESWYIGRLAIEIQTRYEALYKRPLGQIKYLKDAEDDCDLDLELTVSDLLVDEGKAQKDGSDQKRIVLVVVDQGHAVRYGSVVPDLTPLHYQPPSRPPVPKFPGLEERLPDELEHNTRPPKRRRLDQIENDENEEIINSIEGHSGAHGMTRDHRSPSHFDVPGAHFLTSLNSGNVDRAAVDIKRESPGPRFWHNPTPATRDELEYLPQQPETWESRQRRSGLPPSRLQQVSTRAEPVGQQQRTTEATAPITPSSLSRPRQSPSANAISMLNGLKSTSPAQRQSSSSANKFRNSRKNVYDVPESDVDDSQMSPESKAGRKPITPRLVQASRSTNEDSASKRPLSAKLLKKPSTELVPPNTAHPHDESTLMADGSEAAGNISSHALNDRISDARSPDNASWERDGFSKLQKISSNGHSKQDTEKPRGKVPEEDEPASEDETETHSHTSRTAGSREGKLNSGSASTSRSSSIAPSAKSTTLSTSSRHTGTQATFAKDRKTLAESEIENDETLDSPGVQLEEALRQSSPVQRKSKESADRASDSKSLAHEDLNRAILTSREDDEEGDDVTRAPESTSDGGEASGLSKSSQRSKRGKPTTIQKIPKPGPGIVSERRCYTCWTKHCTCDRVKPKCNYCAKWKKNCQIYDMTKLEADREKRNRKLGKKPSGRPVSRGSSASARRTSQPPKSDEIVSASDRDDESDVDEDSGEAAEDREKEVRQEKHRKPKIAKVPNKNSAAKSPPAQPDRQKKKIDKKKALAGHMDETSGEHTHHEDGDGELDQAESIIAIQEARTEKQSIAKPDVKGRGSKSLAVPSAEEKVLNGQPKVATNEKVAAVLDTRCSVALTNGQQCTRILACKKHTVSQKRAVSGRSRPFDELAKEQRKSRTSVNNQDKVPASGAEDGPAASEPRVQKDLPEVSSGPAIGSKASVKLPRPESVGSVGVSSAAGGSATRAKIMPPGMTEEEYDRISNARSSITEEQRRGKNLSLRKPIGTQKDTTPLLVQSPNSQNDRIRLNKSTSSIRSDDKVTSSSQASVKHKQAPASIQPEPNSHTFATATTPGPVNTILPKSAPSKTNTAPKAAADARLAGRLKQHPSVANTASEIDGDKHTNPPFRQPLRKSLLVNTPAANSNLGNVRSLQQLRANLKSGSGTTTPQPQSAKERMAMLKNKAQPRKGFQLEDEEEDDDEEETDSEDDSPSNEKPNPAKAPASNAFTAVNTSRRIDPRTTLSTMNKINRPVDSETDSDSGEW